MGVYRVLIQATNINDKKTTSAHAMRVDIIENSIWVPIRAGRGATLQG